MGNRIWRIIAAALVGALFVTGCSGADSPADPSAADLAEAAASSPAPGTAAELCDGGADRIIARLELFLNELPNISAERFLALDEIDGLSAFQSDIAQVISETTSQSSTRCDLDGLQDLVAARLPDVERDGVLAEFLIATIRDGRELTTTDLVVAPGDDVAAALALLDDGSTLTFAAGTYEIQRPLVVERSIALIGESASSTTLVSNAADAAIVVVGRGDLIMRDLAVEHRGNAVASVVLAFDRPVDLSNVRLSGGVADDQGGAGNGLVLADETLGGATPDTGEKPRSVIVSSIIQGNDGAGIVVSGALNPRIDGVEISENGICGVCFFGSAGGEILNSTLTGNDFGVQIGDSGTPRITGNTISASATAGIAAIGEAAPTIDSNTIEDSGEIGIAVQESASPTITGNTLHDNPFGMSLLSPSPTIVSANTLSGGEIGIQIAENAAPTVADNELAGTTAIGIAISGQAAGIVTNNVIDVGEGVGIVAEGDAAADVDGLVVTGGSVAVAFAGSAAGSVTNATFTGQEIGIQIDEAAHPDLGDIEIFAAESAGIVARGTSTPTAHDVRIVDSGEVGFVVADMSEMTLTRIQVVGGLSGGSVVGTSTPRVEASVFEDLDVGIQIAEQSAPTIVDNDFIEMRAAGLVFIDESSGTAERNRVRDPGTVGIQLGDMAHPELRHNVLFAGQPDDPSAGQPDDPSAGQPDDPSAGQPDAVDDAGESTQGEPPDASDLVVAEVASPDPVGTPDRDAADADESDLEPGEIRANVGILYAGETAGKALMNQIVGFVIGIQVGESAAPELNANSVDGGVLLGVGLLFRDDGAGSAVGNETSRHAVGFQIGDNASPILDANTVLSARNVAFLVQGAANPVLTKNFCPQGLAGIGLLNGTDPTRSGNDCIEVVGE